MWLLCVEPSAPAEEAEAVSLALVATESCGLKLSSRHARDRLHGLFVWPRPWAPIPCLSWVGSAGRTLR